MSVKFLDLTEQTRAVSEQALYQYRLLMERNHFVGGEEVTQFEERFAQYIGVRDCVAVNSGTDALHLGLLAGGIRSEDEIITSPLTFIATAEAANQAGSVRFADVDPETFNLSVKDVEKRISERTRAIVPVHIYGLPADMPSFAEIAKRRDLLLIEDSCQAHGSSIAGRKTGSFGHGGTFSFYPTKNLSAFGDAGAFMTSDPDLSEKVRLLRNHGQTGSYQHDVEGFNSRMDALQAVVLNLKIELLDHWNAQRQAIAEHYLQGIEGLPGVDFQRVPSGFQHVYHLFPILADCRDELAAFLESKKVQNRVIYPVPLHLMPAYRHLGYQTGDFPNAEAICSRVICLPIYPGLEKHQVEIVIECIQEFYSAGA